MAKRKPPPPPALGFQDDTALQTPGPVRDRLIAQMKRQGAKNVRINAIYGKVKAEGWDKLDQEVDALRAAGIAPQVTIMSTPSYSGGLDQTLSAANNNPALWRAWTNEVAKHFKGRVGRYSVGNEQNIGTFQSGPQGETVTTPDTARAAGREYRGIYRAGYAGIKSADPTAQILLGELAPAGNARYFLSGLLGGKKPLLASGFAYHPYGRETMGQDAAKVNSWDIRNLPDLQATLARYKRQGKLQTAQGKVAPLYLTEYGTFRNGSLSDAERLKRLGRAYALAKQAGARQFLAYQLMPSVQPTVTVPGDTSVDAYGNAFAGPARTKPGGWVWDTSIADPGGNLPVINRGMNLTSRSPVARAARARKKAR